jgi:uncharacterized membrane protein
MKLAQDFRRQAKEALRGKWFIALIAGIIASLLGGLNGMGSAGVNFGGSSSSEGGSGTVVPPAGGGDVNVSDEMLEILGIFFIILGVVAVVAAIMSIIYLIVGGAVGIGYSNFNLDIIDGREARIGTLFDSFDQWKTGFVARLLSSLYVTFWSMLFLIPGVIASYSYSMMHFVMAENPDMSANEAIRESKRLMKGNKWRFFCLQLSFIGWELLAIFLTAGIGLLWVVPYQQAAYAAFYRDICPKQQIDTDFVDKSEF